MNFRYLKILSAWIAAVVLVLFAAGCSTKKNTAMSRFYHSFTTSYNVKFNGSESYREGIEALQTTNVDDYTAILPMYPIDNPANTRSAVSQMEKTIEKSRKAIKIHSIKVKPKRNLKKWGNPNYQRFYSQQEFNSSLKESWMLLAQAEFHKGDFLGSTGTFSYISKHYAEDRDIVAQCRLWTARAYLSLGWTYEAEEIVKNIDQTDLRYKNRPLYDAVNAQLLLAQKQYAGAVSFLEKTLDGEKNRYQKSRFAFILGQLYKNQGKKRQANDYFTKVIRMSPPYEMNFYARVNRIDVENKNFKKTHREIRSMFKNPNNREYLDQLFYTDGLIYLAQKDTVRALKHFALAADSSSRNGIDKAIALVAAGDIYYFQKNYIKAHPCYAAAALIIAPENEMYERVNRLSTLLEELAVENQTVVTNDSLLHLVSLPQDEQMKIINKFIEDKKKANEKAVEQAEYAARTERNRSLNPNSREESNVLPRNFGAASSNEWYFYNPNLIKQGKTEFSRRWGNRKLEDNWRRVSKSATLFATNNQQETSAEIADTLKAEKPLATDQYDPAFYLQQLPATPEAKEQIEAQVADAMFNMSLILKDKIEDFPSAMGVFSEFERRFGNDRRVVDAYFQQFVIEERTHDSVQSALYRSKILTEFPDSKYARMLANPDFVGQQLRMFAQQDSIYAATYAAYMRNDFQQVKANNDYVSAHFPQTELMPKFDFLTAMSVGRTQPRDTFRVYLNALVEEFPQADVTTMAKDILALIGQGRENQIGATAGSLVALREESLFVAAESVAAQAAQGFSAEKQGKHRLVFNVAATQQAMNELLYQVAVYNFSRFMIKDFELIMTAIDSTHNMLSVTNLESYDEGRWYENSLRKDTVIAALFGKLGVQTIVISENNFALLQQGVTISRYLAFEQENMSKKQSAGKQLVENKSVTVNEIEKKEIEKKEIEKVEIQVVEIAKNQAKQPSDENATIPENQTDMAVQSDLPAAEMYKNLFAIEPAQPHLVAIVAVKGNINFQQIKTVLNAYNEANYGVMNLQVTLENTGNGKAIYINTFSDSEMAKSYLLRMVREKSLFAGFKGVTYRNLLGTRRNLNVALKSTSNLNTYMEFVREIYLK